MYQIKLLDELLWNLYCIKHFLGISFLVQHHRYVYLPLLECECSETFGIQFKTISSEAFQDMMWVTQTIK